MSFVLLLTRFFALFLGTSGIGHPMSPHDSFPVPHSQANMSPYPRSKYLDTTLIMLKSTLTLSAQ